MLLAASRGGAAPFGDMKVVPVICELSRRRRKSVGWFPGRADLLEARKVQPDSRSMQIDPDEKLLPIPSQNPRNFIAGCGSTYRSLLSKAVTTAHD